MGAVVGWCRGQAIPCEGEGVRLRLQNPAAVKRVHRPWCGSHAVPQAVRSSSAHGVHCASTAVGAPAAAVGGSPGELVCDVP